MFCACPDRSWHPVCRADGVDKTCRATEGQHSVAGLEELPLVGQIEGRDVLPLAAMYMPSEGKASPNVAPGTKVLPRTRAGPSNRRQQSSRS